MARLRCLDQSRYHVTMPALEPFTSHGWMACTSCSAPLHLDRVHEFERLTATCPSCSAEIDLWDMVVTNTARAAFPDQALAILGARATHFKLVLRRGASLAVDFEKYGVPPDAKIIGVNYTPMANAVGASLVPIEMHGNFPRRYEEPFVRYLYPMTVGGEPVEAEVSCAVSWVPHAADDLAWTQLVEAFHQFWVGRFDAAIIPANVAVELTVSRLLGRVLRESAKEKDVEQFLQSAATYSHQWKILLPALVRVHSAPAMREAVRSTINGLRTVRNKIGHSGRPEAPLSKKETAEYICAAVLGVLYVRSLEPFFFRAPPRPA